MVGGEGGCSEIGGDAQEGRPGFGPEGRKILAGRCLMTFLYCLGDVWRRKNAKIFSPSGGPLVFSRCSSLETGEGRPRLDRCVSTNGTSVVYLSQMSRTVPLARLPALKVETVHAYRK